MKMLSMDEIKNIELQLLVDFDRFCKENNLYYTLCGGTLLGAIRHKGFIPWDDDIDVLMPRPDYERLINNIKIDYNCFLEYEKVLHWKNGSLNYPFIKLVDTRTVLDAAYYNSDLGVNNIWIDIFPIDGNPADSRKLKKIYNRSLYFRKILCIKLAQRGEGKTLIKRILKPLLINLLSLLSFSKLCKYIDDLSKTYDFDESKYIGGILWGYGPQERIDKKEYMTPIKVEFEGHLFNAPSNYHEYLSGLYKDYMQLPPEDQRTVHGIKAYMREE